MFKTKSLSPQIVSIKLNPVRIFQVSLTYTIVKVMTDRRIFRRLRKGTISESRVRQTTTRSSAYLVSQRSNVKTLKNDSTHHTRISTVFGHEQFKERYLGELLLRTV